MRAPWPRLLQLAQAEVEATLRELPPRLAGTARALPVVYEPRPNQLLLDDGLAPDTLGLFVGEPRAHEDDGAGGLPPEIILFLENLWEFSERDEEIFCDEVHTTFLHELGHYLGLGEDDLEERGLD
ncbi:MAG: metallopeptidase family protein [Verrucomicrobia bacterium]|nr:metallopeptidase family protein [Verrucomicrobiota bacterium]